MGSCDAGTGDPSEYYSADSAVCFPPQNLTMPTGRTPFHTYHSNMPSLHTDTHRRQPVKYVVQHQAFNPALVAFGLAGFIPHRPHKGKWEDKGKIALYLSITSLIHSLVQSGNGTNACLPLSDFHCLRAKSDPARTATAAFSTFRQLFDRTHQLYR